MVLFWASSAPASEVSPRQTVEKLLDAIRGLKTDNKVSPERQKINQELSLRALEMLDLQEVSREALGKHWSKRTPKEQNGFVKLLSRMFVQEAFPNSGKFFSDLKLVYGKTRIKKSKALVPLTVVHREEGEIAIDFHLHKNGGGWQVTDVDLDEISMRNNLRSQFYKIIDKNDYQDLVRRMEAKLQKIKS
jgi:phospholipid transport system substrate-binding protein